MNTATYTLGVILGMCVIGCLLGGALWVLVKVWKAVAREFRHAPSPEPPAGVTPAWRDTFDPPPPMPPQAFRPSPADTDPWRGVDDESDRAGRVPPGGLAG